MITWEELIADLNTQGDDAWGRLMRRARGNLRPALPEGWKPKHRRRQSGRSGRPIKVVLTQQQKERLGW